MARTNPTPSGLTSAVPHFSLHGDFQATFNALPVGLVYADACGRIVRGNRQAEEIFRHPILPTETAEEHGRWVSFHADGRQVTADEYPLVRVVRGERKAELDVHYARGDGTRGWVRLVASRIDDAEGRLKGGVVAVLDIDAERRAAEAAQDATYRLQVAQRAGEIGTYELLPEEGRVLVSEEFCKVWGLAPTPEISLAEAEALLHPDDLAAVRQAGNYGVGQSVYRIIQPLTGEERWILRRGEKVEDSKGRIRYFGVTYDLTESKRTEEALRESEERLLAAIQGSGAGTFRASFADGILDLDRHLEAMLGLAPGAGPRRLEDCLALIHPDDREEFIARSRQAEESGADFDMEFRVILPDGQERWLHERGKVSFGPGGRPAYMTGACVDVTERMVTMRRLNTVLESITDSFIALDGQWRVTLVNRAAESFLQIDRKDVIGRLLWDVFPELADSPLKPALIEVMEQRHPLTCEIQPQRRPGRTIEIRLSPKEGGGLAANFSDITERKKAEQYREMLLGELNHRVKNTMALVQATAHQTFRSAEVPQHLRQTFEGRLAALARAHDLLIRQSWESATLGEVVRTALDPFGIAEDGRFSVEGPDLRLPAQAAVSLAMALHELATNAVKYGALSGPEGSVALRWSAESERLQFRWTEAGGPEVRVPDERGFGSRLIERALAAELGGKVRMDFAPAGLTCTIEAPLPGA
ncbi:MAG TPA: PAS domain S-box protein [Allosphingosinicella sp.]